MCNLDYDPPIFYTTKEPKANKMHVCYECGRNINKKETYKSVFSVYGRNEWDTYKTCAHCSVGQAWLLKNCDGFMHGMLDEQMLEHAMEHRAFCLYRFVVGMHRKWENMKLPVLNFTIS